MANRSGKETNGIDQDLSFQDFDIPIIPYIQILPSGFDVEGSKLYAVAALSPDCFGMKDRTSEFDLKEWPSALLDHLKNKNWKLPIDVGIAIKKAGEKPCPDDQNLIRINAEAKLLKGASNKKGFIKTAQQLWYDSLGPKELSKQKKHWQDLSKLISESISGESLIPGKIEKNPDYGEDEYPEQKFGNRGQLTGGLPPDKKKKVESVLTIGHTSAAIAMEMRRVEELCDSLKQKADDLPNLKLEAEKKRIRILSEKYNGSTMRKAWLGSEFKYDLKTYVSDKSFSNSPSDSEEIHREKQNQLQQKILSDELRKRKESDHKNYFENTKHNRQGSAKLFDEMMKARSSESAGNLSHSASFWKNETQDLRQKTNRDKALKNALASHFYGSWPQHEDDSSFSTSGKSKTSSSAILPSASNEDVKLASGNIFTLQSTPTLARFVMLNIDLEFPVDEVDKIKVRLENETGDWNAGVDQEKTVFLFLSSPLMKDASERSNRQSHRAIPWVLAKLRFDENWKPTHFLPATDKELSVFDEGALQAEQLSQFDGHVVMSSEEKGEDGVSPVTRFDVTSLDVRMALELEGQRMLTREEIVRAEKDKKTKSENDSGRVQETIWENLAHGGTFNTAGVVALDRYSNGEVVKKLVGRSATCEGGCAVCPSTDGSKYIVLDADDISTGYRLDLGMLLDSEDVAWRSMTNRKIWFGTQENYQKIEDRYLKALVGKPGEPRRIELDRAILGNQSRLYPAQPKKRPGQPNPPSDANPIEVIVDEEITRATGEPMGLSSSAKDAEVWDSLPMGRELSLPQNLNRKEKEALAINLRLGMSLRLNLVRMYIGGVSARPGSIKDADRRLNHQVAFPPANRPDDAFPCIRFLRQHRISAPITLIGEREAIQTWDGGAVTAPQMVVRSFENNDEKLKEIRKKLEIPNTSARHILPPKIDYEKAILHGVFDHLEDVDKPTGPLIRVFFTEGGVYPVVKTLTRRGYDGAAFLEKRIVHPLPEEDEDDSIINDQKLITETQGSAEGKSNLREGDPVLVIKGDDGKKNDYFPDPASEKIAVGIRRTNDSRYLPLRDKDNPLAFDFVLRNEYPNLRDLKLNLTRSNTRTRPSDGLHAEDIIPRPKNLVYNKCPQDPDRFPYSGIRVNEKKGYEINAHLRKGESFEIDLWCVPSARQLAREFALVQALAVYVCKEHEDARLCTSEACIKGFSSIIAESEPELAKDANEIANYIISALTDKDLESRGFYATGSYITPPPTVIKLIADYLHTIMLRRPLREFCAVSTIQVIHAVERPLEEPVLCGVLSVKKNSAHMQTLALPPKALYDQKCLKIVRPSDIDYLNLHSVVDREQLPSSFEAMKLFVKTIKDKEDDEGSTNVVLTGELKLDLETTSGFELSVRTVQPGSSELDSINRGRSLLRRRSGKWPNRRGLGNKGNGISDWKSAEEIFGFSVNKNGEVKHSTSEVTLLRVDDLPRDPDKLEGASYDQETGYTKFSVDRFFVRESDQNEGWHVSARHVFPDGKARLLEITPKAISRTLDHMTTVRRYVDTEFVLPETVPDQFTTTVGEIQQVILPATVRPAKPKVLTPVPVFKQELVWVNEDTDESECKLTRQVVIRIPLDREWCSNGMFEQLGIVVWPPVLEAEYTEAINLDIVPGMHGDYLDIRDYQDQDLGPGGQFITRLGADPIRRANDEFEKPENGEDWKRPGVFLPIEAFRDLNRNEEDPKKARLVKNLLLPFGELKDSVNDRLKPSEVIDVGIIHYQPLFDPETEIWYVDVDLDPQILSDPFIRFGLVRYQPFTKNDLKLSRPVVHWAPLLPERVVKACIKDNEIQIEVQGPASTGSKNLNDDSPRFGKGEEFSQPRMHFRPFIERGGSADRDQLFLREMDDENPPNNIKPSKVGSSDGVTTWTHRILYSEQFANVSEKQGNYLVNIEEIDWRRPAEYGEEPISPHDIHNPDSDLFVPSGPRFSATLDVTQLMEKLQLNSNKLIDCESIEVNDGL